MCPSCGRAAPIVYRGVEAFCTACGHPRLPLVSPGVNLAGRPSRWGGSALRAIGTILLAFGIVTGLILGGIFQAIFPSGIFGWVVGTALAAFGCLFGLPLFLGGRRLALSGHRAQRRTREEAIFQLAAERGGMLTIENVQRFLSLPLTEADSILTALAKEQPERVRLEVDDQGTLQFWFAPALEGEVRVRVPIDPAVEEGEDRSQGRYRSQV